MTLLLALTATACTKLFDPLSGPSGPYIHITGVAITPTTVRAGNPFTVSASVTFGECAPAVIVSYAGQSFSGPFAEVDGTFNAILGQTTVAVDAACFTTGNGSPAVRDDRSIPINVVPASGT